MDAQQERAIRELKEEGIITTSDVVKAWGLGFEARRKDELLALPVPPISTDQAIDNPEPSATMTGQGNSAPKAPQGGPA
ncbi:hypothetical protein LCGC14_0554940 [marine sediment metagenome]|uniref:Uncharacterized protein n=1 Tax=marine sediment metagenome TaxID=412755 RepID=A0A0F9RTS1_9ZZZZ